MPCWSRYTSTRRSKRRSGICRSFFFMKLKAGDRTTEPAMLPPFSKNGKAGRAQGRTFRQSAAPAGKAKPDCHVASLLAMTYNVAHNVIAKRGIHVPTWQSGSQRIPPSLLSSARAACDTNIRPCTCLYTKPSFARKTQFSRHNIHPVIHRTNCAGKRTPILTKNAF